MCVGGTLMAFRAMRVPLTAVIATSSRTERPDYDDTVAPTFDVFRLPDGETRSVRLFDALGAQQAAVEVTRAGGRLIARGDLPGEWTLRWNRGPSVTGTSGELVLQLP